MGERRIEDIKRKSKWHIYLLLIVGVAVTNFPILWVIATSFKPSSQIINSEPVWLPDPILDHYSSLLTTTGDFDFISYLVNSLVVTVITTVLSILVAYPAAYSIARYRTGGNDYSFWVLSIRMLPPVIFLMPISILFALYDLSDTKTGIIIAYLTFNIPFACWIIKSFIEDIPTDLEKAAYMDGYSRFQVMTRIVLPLTRSAVAAVMIICFIFSWNEFLFAMVISFIKSTPTHRRRGPVRDRIRHPVGQDRRRRGDRHHPDGGGGPPGAALPGARPDHGRREVAQRITRSEATSWLR